MRHSINKGFCQSVPQVTLNNFTPYKYFVKFKSSCPKRRLCGEISEIEQNDVTNGVVCVILSRNGKKNFWKKWFFVQKDFSPIVPYTIHLQHPKRAHA